MVDKNELILVIGQSGAGRTTVIHILDDQGFDTLDNVPVHLIPRVVPRELVDKPLALGLDIRSKSFSLQNLMKEISNWKALSKSSVVILFLECSLDVLIKRFSLTRRPHPVPGENNLELSIKRELKLIAPLREKADFVLDTSNTSPNELRLKLGSIFPLAKNRSINIMLQSFSFRNGSPSGVDMIFDCRFLKNPNWEDGLKDLNGTDVEVKDYLRKDESWESFNKSLIQMLLTIIPAFEKEGKSYLSIGLGCTGGQHRSVFVAEQLYKHLLDKSYDVKIIHTILQK
ncbi:MAG: nucleotide-binding protein [Paracoccaceae bacterium]|nr:MAG: nucleotide-binding protein [Paracoccaceae bacterium]